MIIYAGIVYGAMLVTAGIKLGKHRVLSVDFLIFMLIIGRIFGWW
jgi:hypothetical protein